MALIAPYLNFEGTTEDAFNFYQSIFGGEFTSVQRFSDTPHGANMPADDAKKIMHISWQIDKDTIVMASDNLPSMGMPPLTPGNNISLSVHPKTVDEGKRIFNGLAAGGQVMVPFEKAFWGAWFGMLTDQFGIKWMVNVPAE